MSIVNPNMVQLQNFLKSMSPQEWAHFVQNPSSQVPGLLISMESERRIKEANEAKNAQAQVPMGTIKDKVNAEAARLANPTPTGLGSLMAQNTTQPMDTHQPPVMMAEGGVAGLDTGDMYNEEHFATGGIVAFADGGKTDIKDASNLNNLPTLNLNTGKASTPGLPGALGNMPGFQNAMKMFTSPSLAVYDTMGSKLGKNMEIVPGVNNPVYFLTQAAQYAKSHPITSEGNWWKDYTSYLSNRLNPPTLESAPTPIGPTGPGYTEPLYPTGSDFAATVPTSYGTYGLAKPYAAGGEVKRFDGLDGSLVDLSNIPNEYTDPQDIRGKVLEGYQQALPGLIDKKSRGIDLTPDEQKIIDTMYSLGRYKTPMLGPTANPAWVSKDVLNPPAKPAPSKTVMAPTIEVTDKKVPPASAKKELSVQEKLKAANDKYNAAADKITADQTTAYDSAMKRLMDIYSEEDPARKELRAEYEKKKGNAVWDVLGDIGAGLSQAKKGREWEAAGTGFKAGQARMAELDKEGKALTLEDMKTKHELKLLGAKYGFDSEQFKEKLQANRQLEREKMANELEKANIIYGNKANIFDSGQLVKQDKYVKDWLAGEGKAYAPFLTADENAKGISPKMRDQIIAAKKAHNAKKAEAATRFPAQQYAYGQSGLPATNIMQFDASGNLVTS